jgi:hypothetical protein
MWTDWAQIRTKEWAMESAPELRQKSLSFSSRINLQLCFRSYYAFHDDSFPGLGLQLDRCIMECVNARLHCDPRLRPLISLS